MEDTTLKTKPNTTKSNRSQLSVRISMTDLDLFEDATKIITDFCMDERIDEDIRNQYYSRLLDVFEKEKCRK